MTNSFLLFLVSLTVLSTQLNAEPLLISSRSIGITQAIGSHKTKTSNESINITTLTPSYSATYEKSKIKVIADYSLIASRDNESNDSDISHKLNLVSSFTHIPEQWTSTFTSRILQKNISDTGSLVDDSNITSDATSDYRVNTLGTSRSHRINSNLNLNSSIGLTAQGFKDESTDKNLNASLTLNVIRILPSISLNTSLRTNKDLNNKASINTLELTSFYTLNPKVKTYIKATKYSTNNDTFNDSKYSIGLNWDITSNSFVNIDIGKFGDDTSWSIDSSIKLRRSSIVLKRTEEINNANQALLDNLDNDIPTFSDTTINLITLNKSTSAIFSHHSRRLTSSLTLTKNQTFSDLNDTKIRDSASVKITFNYRVNRLSSASYTFSNNSIEITNKKNQFKSHSVNWSSKLSKKSSYNVTLKLSEQDSKESSLGYNRSQLDFNYQLSF